MPRHSRGGSGRPEPDLPAVPVSSDSLRSALQLARYLLPYRLKFLAVLACMGVSSLCLLAFPAVTGLLVNAALGQSAGPQAGTWAHDVNGVALALVGVIFVHAATMFVQIRLFFEV